MTGIKALEDHRGQVLDVDYADGSRSGGWRAADGEYCPAGGCVRLGQGDEVFCVPVAGLAQFTAAIWEAAGKPEPVILDRPEATSGGGISRAGRIEVGRLRDLVTVGLYGIQPEEIEPEQARRLAALIAIRAGEAAEDEPDPAEVEELAAAIRRELHPDSGKPAEADRTAARAALRWMKQQREGTP